MIQFSFLDKMGIQAKLISVFILIKIIPLLLLAILAWRGLVLLERETHEGINDIDKTVNQLVTIVGDRLTADSIAALNKKSRESIERLSNDTAFAIADFLYTRDDDIRFLSRLPVGRALYKDFLQTRKRNVYYPEEYVLSEDQSRWVKKVNNSIPKTQKNPSTYNVAAMQDRGVVKRQNLYLEASFVSLDGTEQVKIVNSDLLSKQLRDVSRKSNTFLKAETYFQELKKLEAGEIYVSRVIGAYQKADLIGPYTRKRTEEANIAFEPEKQGYGGLENPLGKRFQGIVRWATPVVRQGKIIGYVTLALDHTHIMEFTDHIIPTNERFTPIGDPGSGNYAFMWDFEGRNISHVRDYFIVGYDGSTGNSAIPWIDQTMYEKWQKSGQDFESFATSYPIYKSQSLENKPAVALIRKGLLGLDCRYLNFAPQCEGWHQVTQKGGAGSFEIFWSGLQKLTTVATIPYYTGQYGKTLRGFGYVTIGANIHEFHSAATASRERMEGITKIWIARIKDQQGAITRAIEASLKNITKEISISTIVMSILVIIIAIWIAWALTRRIKLLVTGVQKFSKGDLELRIPPGPSDEIGELIHNFNLMADRLNDSFINLEKARLRAEESSRLKSDFLANISHELRTPLNGILGFSDLLLHDIKDEDVKSSLLVINQSGHHLLKLVNSVLDLAQIEAGRMTLHVEECMLGALLDELISGHQAIAQTKNLEFKYVVDKAIPQSITVDPTRLRQVLDNILNNAVKFTHQGFVALSADRKGDFVRFTVTDSGPGIPKEKSAVIFEKFRQAESFRDKKHEGSGLGLAITSEFLSMMGGSISLHHPKAGGSEFICMVPIQYKEPKKKKEETGSFKNTHVSTSTNTNKEVPAHV